jgi:hypothetical protein
VIPTALCGLIVLYLGRRAKQQPKVV